MADNELKILQDARQLISDPAHWTKGAYARVKKGSHKCDVKAPEATCFCLQGALIRVGGTYGIADACHLVEKAISRYLGVHYISIPEFNDSPQRKHSQIMKVMNMAIELAETNLK